eukprot:2543734-Amphidinium_carterae.3
MLSEGVAADVRTYKLLVTGYSTYGCTARAFCAHPHDGAKQLQTYQNQPFHIPITLQLQVAEPSNAQSS